MRKASWNDWSGREDLNLAPLVPKQQLNIYLVDLLSAVLRLTTWFWLVFWHYLDPSWTRFSCLFEGKLGHRKHALSKNIAIDSATQKLSKIRQVLIVRRPAAHD